MFAYRVASQAVHFSNSLEDINNRLDVSSVVTLGSGPTFSLTSGSKCLIFGGGAQSGAPGPRVMILLGAPGERGVTGRGTRALF